MKAFITCLFLVMVTPLATASSERVYLSPMEQSRWVLSQDSPILCSIEHDIPRFGKAVFSQQSGRALQLEFRSHHRYRAGINIAFRSVSANWKGIHTQASLASLTSSGQSDLVQVVDDAARQAYFELQQGYQPALFFIDDEDGWHDVNVILSTVRFRDVEKAFEECVDRLHPHHFDDINTARVHFDFDAEFPIENEEDQALSKILEYLKVDSDVKTVEVVGHTDFKGAECYNETLSARRAWYVYDYLVQSGVEPRQIRVSFKGENQPLRKGKDDFSRALNRRVEVRLVK